MNDVDVLVVGVGVFGLVCVVCLVEVGYGVLVVECEWLVGSYIFSCNFEVIYVGFYYLFGLFKVDFCLEGCECLYVWCVCYGVGYWCIGKLLVVVEENECEKFQVLVVNVCVCGVDDLMLLDGIMLCVLEFQVCGVVVLFLLSMGIIDSYVYL